MSNWTIDAATLRQWLADDEELAVLDIRSPEKVGYASPLFATNLPADRVEAEIDRFVPRKPVRTVLVDDGGGAAEGLAEKMARGGRDQVFALQGGIPEWTKDGVAGLRGYG